MNLIEIKKSKVEDVQKFVFQTQKGELIEFSLIRKGDGKDIICTPTQTSCNMGCQFCHLTGLNLPVRNLDSTEILDHAEAVGFTFNQLKMPESRC